MSLENVIQENTAALLKLVATLNSTAGNVQEATPANDAKPAETTKAPAKSTGSKPSKPAPKAAQEGPALIYEDVKKRVVEVSKAKGRDDTIDLLARFGVDKAPDLKENQYAQFVEAADLVLSGIGVDAAVAQVRGE